jgi:HNH endonuclease
MGPASGRVTKRGEPMAYLLAHLTTMPTECTTWPYGRTHSFVPGRGYGTMKHEGRTWLVHVLVCTWYHGPRPPGQQVAHSCGRGLDGCFTPTHLRWATPQDNGSDRRLGYPGQMNTWSE